MPGESQEVSAALSPHPATPFPAASPSGPWSFPWGEHVRNYFHFPAFRVSLQHVTWQFAVAGRGISDR